MKNSLLLVLVQLTFGFAQEKFEIRKEVSKEINVNMLILKQVR
jgi:hypothetical protein